MLGADFVRELEALKAERLAGLTAAGRVSLGGAAGADSRQLLEVALSNEISVSELAAAWMPSTPELDVKLAFARQAGDEASHFQLVAERLAGHGFELSAYQPPPQNALFQYLAGLSGSVERIAAGLVTLESLAYAVNETFIAWCEQHADPATARIYREFIQPDERAHQQLGQKLLAQYATTPALQNAAREVSLRVLDIAGAARAKAAERMGTACFPGC